ncbi:hypothetical protein [Flavobacterium litorale]|uniref:DUF748 domain-containing protein n=1 Tax=Flavobacterium litorale TaxID=2856519 RepID=A0ABX8V7C1_9FLAO|nr:hypothetical protein [Flavobacterium litorale]QYJ68637.1 hypothetical protein K1I41_01805 [Flavobacterium litorale]
MRVLKKVVFILICIVSFLLILNFGLSYWVTKKLPSVIESQKNITYNISYNDIDIQLVSGNFTVHNVYFAPKGTTKATMNSGAFCKIEKIDVEHFNLWALLWDDRIEVESIIIDTPEIVLYKNKKQRSEQDNFIAQFENTIVTEKIKLKQGRFRMVDSLENILAKANNINFEVNNTRLDSTSASRKIPISYGNYSISCDSVFYKVSPHYAVSATNINNNKNSFSVSNFKLIPQQNRKQFNKMIPAERDQFTLTAKKIKIPKNNWGYTNDTLFVHVPKISIAGMDATIYRGKMVKDNLKTKKLYSEMLRELDFDLKVDTLLLKKTRLAYEEQLSYNKAPGKVLFSDFDAAIYNIYSPVGKNEIPDTKIDVQCLFMDDAPLHVNWVFNTLNASDAFTIQGKLQNLNLKNINSISKSLMNTRVSGNIKALDFTINGNKQKATGRFAINYNNLQLDVLQENSADKNEFLSFVGNLVVKEDSNSNTTATDVTVERANNKSVFNFLWLFLKQGLKNTMLPL